MLKNSHLKARVRQLQEVKELVKCVLESHHLKLKRVTKNGPRYFIVECTKNSKKYVFKTCLYAKSFDPSTNSKFIREVLLLKYITGSKKKFLRQAIPEIYKYNTRKRIWSIREYIDGTWQNSATGIVKFKPSFFTLATIKWIIAFIREFQKINPQKIPGELSKVITRYYPLARIIYYINRNKTGIIKVIGQKEYRTIIGHLKSNRNIYNQARLVLAHNEPYASHFIKKKEGDFTLIDWENFGLSNSVHDLAIIWMRASSNPAWQSRLLLEARKNWPRPNSYNSLLKIELLIQSLCNVSEINYIKNKKDFFQLSSFSTLCLQRFLKGEKLF